MKQPERRINEKLKTVTLIITILIFISSIISATIIYANTQNGILNNVNRIMENDNIQEIKINNLEEKAIERQNILTELKTNQEWIMNTLIEIKERLK